MDFLPSQPFSAPKPHDLVEQLEDKGRIVVIRPEKPMEVDRIETDIKKLTDLYEEGYVCAKKMFEEKQILQK